MKKFEYLDKNITLDVLNNIKVGDTVKCNDWGKGLKVRAVTNNYILMSTNIFAKTLYSVCCKIPSKYGKFYIGTDNLVFGHICEYQFNNLDMASEYLLDFEDGKIELSRRSEVALDKMIIKKMI